MLPKDIPVGRNKDLYSFEVGQSYEFEADNSYSKDVGLNNYMSDLLGSSTYDGANNYFHHNFYSMRQMGDSLPCICEFFFS